MSQEWTDRIAGARMAVDQQFQARIRDSRFSNQEWGLVMTAVEFDIERPDDPASAELVAHTDTVEQILPELDNLPRGMGGTPDTSKSGSSGGVLKRFRGLFGGSGTEPASVDQEDLEAARRLVEAYTDELQAYLIEEGQWEDVCAYVAKTS